MHKPPVKEHVTHVFVMKLGQDVLTMTISAMLVAWRPCSVLNQDYILTTCRKYVDQWDCNIERKAGGLDSSIDMAQQHLTLTNMSSLLALIAEATDQNQRIHIPDKRVSPIIVSVFG